jgi:hypothetical protein
MSLINVNSIPENAKDKSIAYLKWVQYAFEK